MFGLLVSSCKTPNKAALDKLIDDGSFIESELKVAIKTSLTDSSIIKSFIWKLRFSDTLFDFYAERTFQPVWAMYLVNDSMADLVFKVLENSRLDGFKAEYYRVDSLRSMLRRLKRGDVENPYAELAKIDLLMSDNMLSFHHDRVFGRTDPNKVFKAAYQLPTRFFPNFKLLDVLSYKQYPKVLEKNTITDTAYWRLTDLLKFYYNKLDAGEKWFQIDTVGIKKLEPGDTTMLMPAIAEKLFLMQVLSAKEAKEADSFMYDKDYAKYIRRFQQRFGLFDDAVLGRKTFGLLNSSLQDIIDQIAANLERIRWFQLPEEKPYIAVNLPAYELGLFYPDSIKYMRVCIGKAHPPDYDAKMEKYLKELKYWLRPADHETPQIKSGVVYMVVNPTWTVPNSIISREMFYKMKRDNNYLKDNGYGVFYKGKELLSDSINWAKYSPTKVPFNIVQKAGDENALGKVKFIFPNPFQIYLHDTPQKSKFKWTERAVSHGCVRVEKPLELGAFLTQNIKKYDEDDFRIMMGQEPLDAERLKDYDPLDSLAKLQPIDTTMLIRLEKSIPVYFLYNTIWFDQDGQVQYRNDVYDKNKYIIRAMNF
ncbi:MAG: murein L,D-transpeptidase YcbB/YkuD [Bacteroidia bacterium]